VGQLKHALERLLEQEKRWNSEKRHVFGISTGFAALDEITRGLHPGELVVVVAKTSHGKSAFINQIVFNVAQDLVDSGKEGKVLLYSPEMTEQSLLLRQISAMSGVSPLRIRSGEAGDDREKWLTCAELLLKLDNVVEFQAGRSLDLYELLSDINQRKLSGPPIVLVAVDYLQRITVQGNSTGYDEVSRVSLELKNVCNVENIPIIIGSQVTGDPERATMHNVRGSGRVKEDADAVWVIDNPHQTGPLWPATLTVEKNRSGLKGAVALVFDPERVVFEDVGYFLQGVG
jgi:replicative DNA helicase